MGLAAVPTGRLRPVRGDLYYSDPGPPEAPPAPMLLHDLPGVAAALALGPLLLVVPGFVADWAGDLLDFRARPAGVPFLLSPPLSLTVLPLLAFLSMPTGVSGLVCVRPGLHRAAFPP